MNTCPRLYWIPFRDAWRLFRTEGTKPPAEEKPWRDAVTPAE